MPEYRICRDGQQYLVFSGHVVAEASNRLQHGQEQDRWTDIRVYRTDSGSYVVEQVLRSLWQKGDAVWYQGDLCPTPPEVYGALVGVEADPRLGDLEKDLLHQLAAQDPRFAELLTEQNRCQEYSVQNGTPSSRRSLGVGINLQIPHRAPRACTHPVKFSAPSIAGFSLVRPRVHALHATKSHNVLTRLAHIV